MTKPAASNVTRSCATESSQPPSISDASHSASTTLCSSSSTPSPAFRGPEGPIWVAVFGSGNVSLDWRDKIGERGVLFLSPRFRPNEPSLPKLPSESPSEEPALMSSDANDVGFCVLKEGGWSGVRNWKAEDSHAKKFSFTKTRPREHRINSSNIAELDRQTADVTDHRATFGLGALRSPFSVSTAPFFGAAGQPSRTTAVAIVRYLHIES